MQRREFQAMGSTMLALVDSQPAAAPVALEAVPDWFASWEQHLSRFRDDSELSRLNRAPGAWTPVSEVLWDVVDAAVHAAAETDGLVSPTLLAAVEAAGYDRSFALLGQDDAASAGRTLPPGPPPVLSWWAMERDVAAHALRLPRGLRLDVGGIAKGWAADRAVERLAAFGPALVDAGGDLAVSGPLHDGSAWPIGVADPAAPETDLEVLAIRAGGVATSGRDYRRWQQGGRWQHHIIDPRSGCPATTDVLSATLVAPTACAAEAAAKTALLLGSGDGLAWIDARPALAGLLVLEDGQVLRSRRLARYTP